MSAGGHVEAPTADDLRALLLRGQDAPHPLGLFSDEELAALDDAAAHGVAPHPWLDAEDVDQQTAARFGLRSLLVRGLVRLDGGAPRMTLETATAVGLRRSGLGMVRADREPPHRGHRVLVVQPELGALEEDVSPDGLHLMSTCADEAGTARLAAWAVPDALPDPLPDALPDAGPADPALPRATVSPDEWPTVVLEALGEHAVRTSVLVLLPDGGGPPRPRRWTLATSGAGALLGVGDTDARLAVTATDRDGLARRLRDEVARARG